MPSAKDPRREETAVWDTRVSTFWSEAAEHSFRFHFLLFAFQQTLDAYECILKNGKLFISSRRMILKFKFSAYDLYYLSG